MSTRRLVADAGGTNVRFALADPAGELEQVLTYRVADFASFKHVMSAYLAAAGGPRDVGSCAIAAAGPVDGDFVKLTNNPWSIDRAEVSAALAGVPVALVNDVEGVAAALPHLGAGDALAVGGPAPLRADRRTMVAVNVGTGINAASAVRHGGQWWTCPSEAGHMTLGPIEADGIELAAEDSSFESVLSGDGLVALYDRLARAAHGSAGTAIDAKEVFARAESDAVAARAVDLFTGLLGRVAGDLCLATAAWGGVYLCGSVALGWSGVADAGRFRAEFERKGPMRARMERVPTAVLRRENVCLFGLAMMPVPG